MLRVVRPLPFVCAATLTTSVALAAPPTPSGAHPRLFMSGPQLAAYTANAAKQGTAAANLVAQCADTVKNPGSYKLRAGDHADADGNTWPQAAVACAFAYEVTKNSQYLTQALLYWGAALSDDQSLGDGLGCAPGVSTDWKTWASGGAQGAAPPVVLTVTHDTGYPIRWFAADVALAYDWLYGESAAQSLVQQTQVCLPNWLDYYTAYGYHHDEAGANYNAGYIAGKAFGAVALGTDGGQDGHLWSEIVDDDFGKLLVGEGLAGAKGDVGTPAGVMVGGDWGEGWQYGPYSVLEYAAATSVLVASGASQPEMADWASSLALRTIYAATPTGKFAFCGTGDCDITTANNTISQNELDAVLVGPSSDDAAAWATNLKSALGPPGRGAAFVYNAFAEARGAGAADYTLQTPAPPLWYLAHGTRSMYVRTAWNDPNAYWGVFSSSPKINSDHQHIVASSFVFSRGADDLIVDSSPYGGYNSADANATSADSTNVSSSSSPYAETQTPWSKADLPWARGTSDATYAARSDFAHGFDFQSKPSDIHYAHREWVMLPEGEVVVIDRVHTSGATDNMYVTLHTNTGGGKLAAAAGGGIYQGTVGSSVVAIHQVVLSSGATTTVTQPSTKDCTIGYPGGACDTARFADDAYHVKIPGPYAVAVHVVDGVGATEALPTVDSMNDANIDPAGGNGAVVGAGVFRASKQSYVVASSAEDGASPATMTYGVPGGSAARHVVFDAPEASDGTSAVSASAAAGRCVVSITAGSGGGFAGHPLMFQVGDASGGCTASDSTAVPSGTPPPGNGVSPPGSGSSGGGGVGVKISAHAAGGCGCGVAGRGGDRAALLVALGAFALAVRRRARSLSRS